MVVVGVAVGVAVVVVVGVGVGVVVAVAVVVAVGVGDGVSTMNRARIFLAILAILATTALLKGQDAGRIDYARKAGHFSAGFVLAWGPGTAGHPKFGLALGIGAGIAKEVSDRRGGESLMSCRRDVLITSAGALLGWYLSKPYQGSFAPSAASCYDGHLLDDHMSTWDRQQDDIRMQAEFKTWEVEHAGI